MILVLIFNLVLFIKQNYNCLVGIVIVEINTMQFKKFNSIENTYRTKFVDQVRHLLDAEGTFIQEKYIAAMIKENLEEIVAGTF